MTLTPHYTHGSLGAPMDNEYIHILPTETPIPTQNELLTREQTIELIKAHTPIKDEDDRSWIRASTLYTILEGDENNGRAIAASPKNTALALGAYELFTKKDLCDADWSGHYLEEETKSTIQNPTQIIEFIYDFSRQEKNRFCSLRAINPENYLLAAKDLPKIWIDNLAENYGFVTVTPSMPGVASTFPAGSQDDNSDEDEEFGFAYTDFIGDPIDIVHKRRIPNIFPVKYADSRKLRLMQARRTVISLIRLSDNCNLVRTIADEINWDIICAGDRSFVTSKLPTLIRDVFNRDQGAFEARNTSIRLIRNCINVQPYNPFFGIPPAKQKTHSPTNFKNICEALEIFYEQYKDQPDGIEDTLYHMFYYLGMILPSNGTPKGQVPKDTIAGYIKSFMKKTGVPIEVQKSKVMRMIIDQIDVNNPNTAFLHNNLLEKKSIEKQIREDLHLYMPALRGFTEIFGERITLSLDHDWHRFLARPDFNYNPFFGTSANHINISKCRAMFLHIFSLVDSFTLDKDNLRGGDRLNLANALIYSESEEIIRDALGKKMTTTADLRRALKSTLAANRITPMIPYLIYLTKKEEKNYD